MNPEELIDPVTLIGELARSGGSDDEILSLLTAFQRGLEIGHLEKLLRSENRVARRGGIWIASELGASACDELSEIGGLLLNSDAYVRFYALDVVLCCASTKDSEILGRAVGLIEDLDEGVRWKALRLLALGTREQLAAAAESCSSAPITDGVSWILRDPELDEILSQLEQAPLKRRFAVAAAARTERGRAVALRRAAESSDTEVRSFAIEQLEAMD
ncbi:MAG: hypothetical protein QM648_04935 [Solirubrobacterales bacterium]